MTDLASLQRLRDAADRLRPQAHHPQTGPLTRAILTGVADWLEDTARRAGYTTRGVDATNAHRIADVILDGRRTEAGHAQVGEEPEEHTQPGVEGNEPTHPGSFWDCEQPVCAKSRAQHEAAADIQDLTYEILAAEDGSRHKPLTDEPCGVIPTPRGRQVVNAYRAHRTEQHPKEA